MKPFKLFFGLSIGIILFLFVARVIFIAFIAAALLSIAYAIFRRVKDFITYDRYGDLYLPKYEQSIGINKNWKRPVEPLFQEMNISNRGPLGRVHFIDAL